MTVNGNDVYAHTQEFIWNPENTLSWAEIITQINAALGTDFPTGAQCTGNKTCRITCHGQTYVITGLGANCTCLDYGVNCPNPCPDLHIQGCEP